MRDFIFTSGNGGHLRCTTHLYVGDYSHLSCCVAGFQKSGFDLRNSVDILHCIVRYLISTSGFGGHLLLICESRRHRTVSTIVPLCSLTTNKIGLILGFPLLPCIETETSLFHTYFRFMVAIVISCSENVINCSHRSTIWTTYRPVQFASKYSYPCQR